MRKEQMLLCIWVCSLCSESTNVR